jgi:uncharacterized membrane protein YhaH (DUF805 family)
MSNINWGHLLFGFSGRINRAKWWLTVLVSIIISVVAAIIAAIVGENLGNIVTLIAFIPQFWIGLAAGAKRLHDLNRTGAWLVFFYLAPVVLVIIFFVVAGMDVMSLLLSGGELDGSTLTRIGTTGAIVGLLVFILGIWALIWFGCLRGTVGPNQYGPDPLEGKV